MRFHPDISFNVGGQRLFPVRFNPFSPPMRTIVRFFVVGGLLAIAYVLSAELRTVYAQEDVDATRVVVLFTGLVLVALAAGAFFVVSFLPDIGEGVGNFFFNPSVEIERNPHADALAAIAR